MGFVLAASLSVGCAVTPVDRPAILASIGENGTGPVEGQRYRVTGVLPGVGAVRLTSRDHAGRRLSPAVRDWVAPWLYAGTALLLNTLTLGTPTIWHLVAGQSDFTQTPDRWCTTTLIGSCRVLVEPKRAGRAPAPHQRS